MLLNSKSILHQLTILCEESMDQIIEFLLASAASNYKGLDDHKLHIGHC